MPLDSPPPEAAGIAAPGAGPVRRRTDGLAVASAICGFTAIVPFASQVIGLVLGFASLARIRRARREGMELAGARWAYTGIISSGLTLLGWVALFVLMSMLSSSLSQSVESLGSLLPQVP